MKRRISSTLMALVLCLTLLPAAAYAAGGTAVYVSSSGNDGTGDGSADKPYATLAKAVDAAENGATVYVMSDLTMTAPPVSDLLQSRKKLLRGFTAVVNMIHIRWKAVNAYQVNQQTSLNPIASP